MKNLMLLLIAVFLFSCSKEKVYGPRKLTDGQEVELLVDHRYGADNEILLHLPANEPAGASLYGFTEREPGFTYRVKAMFHNNENPPQDAASYWFDFVKVISKEQYKGTEAYAIQLIRSYIPGGPVIWIGKEGNDYYLLGEKIQLTYTDPMVGNQLEEIIQHAKAVRESWPVQQNPKWKTITATVLNDPSKFGKAYLVQKLDFK
jgi:hypothetical protein